MTFYFALGNCIKINNLIYWFVSPAESFAAPSDTLTHSLTGLLVINKLPSTLSESIARVRPASHSSLINQLSLNHEISWTRPPHPSPTSIDTLRLMNEWMAWPGPVVSGTVIKIASEIEFNAWRDTNSQMVGYLFVCLYKLLHGTGEVRTQDFISISENDPAE